MAFSTNLQALSLHNSMPRGYHLLEVMIKGIDMNAELCDTITENKVAVTLSIQIQTEGL